MASSKQDGTAAAAAEQLGSISLGGSAEKKDSETEPTTHNGTPTELLCSACGKKGDKCTLMKCRACKCVWYCDKDCQKKHWKEHKKECKRIKKELDERGGKLNIGTEKNLGPLPDLPPREECPICMCELPTHESLTSYFVCCGKIICSGCNYQHQMKSGQPTCAFCREPITDEEMFTRYRKRIERGDTAALYNMAIKYRDGKSGLAVDQTKCIELLRDCADLGCPEAQYYLGEYHHDGEMGLEENEGEAVKYWEKAAAGGRLLARHNLGCIEEHNGDHVAAMRHFRMSASAGYMPSMGSLIGCFQEGSLQHEELAKTLRAFYGARAERKGEGRDLHIKYLKMTGAYHEEFNY